MYVYKEQPLEDCGPLIIAENLQCIFSFEIRKLLYSLEDFCIHWHFAKGALETELC